jgi:antitoxin (DNA-binding transcriptional repressor) of toxin-antitoxin stability system
MATTIELADAQARLQQLVLELSAGDEIVLVDHGKAMARLLPVTDASQRTPGLHEGEGWISDDFSDPTTIAPGIDEMPKPRTPGLHPNNFSYISEDFDDPLPDSFWLGNEDQ